MLLKQTLLGIILEKISSPIHMDQSFFSVPNMSLHSFGRHLKFSISAELLSEARALTIGLGGASKRSSEEPQASQQTQQETGAGRGLQTPQCPSMSPGTGGSSNSGTGPRPGPTLINKTLSQGQQSPQHSTTPSGGSTTPDIKYSNDKMANEIQVLYIFFISKYICSKSFFNAT